MSTTIEEFTSPYDELMRKCDELEARIRADYGLEEQEAEPEQKEPQGVSKTLQARFGYREEDADEELDRAFGVTAPAPITSDEDAIDRVFGVSVRNLDEDEKFDRAFQVGEFAPVERHTSGMTEEEWRQFHNMPGSGRLTDEDWRAYAQSHAR